MKTKKQTKMKLLYFFLGEAFKCHNGLLVCFFEIAPTIFHSNSSRKHSSLNILIMSSNVE